MNEFEIGQLISRRLNESHSDHLGGDVEVKWTVRDGWTIHIYSGEEGLVEDAFSIKIERYPGPACVNPKGHKYGDRDRPNDQLGGRCMHCGAQRPDSSESVAEPQNLRI